MKINNIINCRGFVQTDDSGEEKITLSVAVAADGKILAAVADVTGDGLFKECAETVCRVIEGVDIREVPLMGANAVIYNTESEIPRGRLYCASAATLAAKKAAADWAKQTGEKLNGKICC